MTPTDYFLQVISLLGGLSLFLFGMDIMGKALERQAGGKLQTILASMSSTPLRGFLLGLAVTAVIQSSSATTVMVVGFVNSGIMALRQAIGIIMGANVGTTGTAWILSLSSLEGDSLLVQIFKPSTLSPLLGAIGIVLFMAGKSDRKKGVGTILLGFTTLMTGMELMSGAMEFLENEVWFQELFVSFSNPLLGVLAGAVLTGIIQSSSASVGILQGLCVTGAVTYGAAIPIIMGQNIGTCVTAILASVGTNKNARRTAMVHLYFNIIGVAVFLCAFYLINVFFPWPFLEDAANAVGIAKVHTTFNLCTTAVLLPLNRKLEQLALRTIPDSPEPEKTALLDERLLATPAVAVQRAWEITCRMAQMSSEAFSMAVKLTHSYDPQAMEQLRETEDETDRYEDALGTYLVKLSGARLAGDDNRRLNTLLYTIGDFERIADHAVSIGAAGREIKEKPVRFSTQAQQELSVLERAVGDVLQCTISAFTEENLQQAAEVESLEQVVDSLVHEIKTRHVKRLRQGTCTVEYGFVLDDLLTAYERIADHCSSIAVEMLQMSAGKMERHEYLGALKAGALNESAQFNRRYEEYRQRYAFADEQDESEDTKE